MSAHGLAERRAVDALAQELAESGVGGARLAIVLGSGLGAFAERLTDARALEARELPSLPVSRVPGHAGRILAGTVEGVPVVVQQGRVHLYEGRTAHEVARPVRAFARLGVRGVLLTNAAGGLHAEQVVGSFLALRDHINLQGRTPLRRGEATRASPYDDELLRVLQRAAERVGEALTTAVYAGVLGPAYETPAEIRMLRSLGADAVGMSTVVEASAACAAGLRVCALASVTNHAAGVTARVLSHDDVLAVGRRTAARLAGLVEGAVADLDRALGRAPDETRAGGR